MMRLPRWLIPLLLAVAVTTSAQTLVPAQKLPAGLAPDVRRQIEALYSKDSGKVIEAAEKLGDMGARAAPAIPFLISLLRYHGLECFQAGAEKVCVLDVSADTASEALGKIGAPSVEPLRAALGSQDENVRRWVSITLARINDPAATEILMSAIRNPSSPARKEVARGLGYSTAPRAVEVLATALKDQDPLFRHSVANGLGKSNDLRAVEPLLLALQDENADVRSAAAGGLANKKDSRVAPALIAALKDDSAKVKQSAALSLGRMKDRAAVEPLIELLATDADKDVRFRADHSLQQITGRKMGPDAARWREWWQKQKPASPQ